MSKQPSHIAYLVTDPKQGSGKKSVWHRVGSIWPHASGKGFDLAIPAGMSVSGRVVCVERSDKRGMEHPINRDLLEALVDLHDEAMRGIDAEDSLSLDVLDRAQKAIETVRQTE